MGLLDNIKQGIEQKREAEQAQRIANKSALDEYKMAIAQSSLVQDLLETLESDLEKEENSWIRLAKDYYDHDPREVSIAPNGDGFRIQRVRYHEEEEIRQVPHKNGGMQDVKVLIYKGTVVEGTGYGFTVSDYKPIDRPRVIRSASGAEVTLSVEDVRKLVAEIVYDKLKQLLPQCTFDGRVSHKLGLANDYITTEELTYHVPARVYKDWY